MPAILKSTKPAPAPKPKATKERLSKASTAKPPKPKLAKEKSTKTTLPQKAGKGKIAKVRKAKSPFLLVDEPDEEPAQSEPKPELEHQGEGNKDDMELAIQMSLELFQAQSQEHVGAIEASSTRSSTQAQDDTSANTFCDSPYPVDAKTGVASEKTNSGCDTEILEIDEEQRKDVNEQVNLEEKKDELDQGQTGSDPSRTPKLDLHLSILKFSVDEDVILEDPIRSTRTLSLIKNLEDAYAVGDQFLNDNSTEDEPKKPNVEAKVVSMVTVPIYQASFSVPSLSTPIPVIDLLPPKPASSTTQAPIFIATTTTTTTTLPPPPQKQNTTESKLAARNIGSRVFHLELRDLPHMIDEAVCESVREARMFETDTYKSLLKHVALYEALEASIERANRDELLTEMDKSHTPPSSSKQQSGPHTEQPVEDLPMPETANISDLEKTDSAHLLKIKQRPEWLKPILDDLNLTKPGWDAKGFEYKHDCTIIDSPRAVVFPVGNNERKIMRFNEIYKFSDGMLMKIMEALDFRVKEYKVNRLNSCMNARFWTDKDVARSKEFIHAIERRLKTRRIFQNLECFVGGRPEPEGSTRDNPLVSIEALRYDIKRSKCENKGIVPTEMELELEQT
nr:hypothetical protein [Tanacetum cinerariifolium]